MADDRTPRLRWFRFAFSLRTLFVAVTLVALIWWLFRPGPTIHGSLPRADFDAIRETVALDSKVENKSIKSIVVESPSKVRVFMGENPGGDLLRLQKNNKTWVIASFSVWAHATRPYEWLLEMPMLLGYGVGACGMGAIVGVFFLVRRVKSETPVHRRSPRQCPHCGQDLPD